MSHRTLSTTLRVVAVLVVVAVCVSIVPQAGSQGIQPPERMGPPSLPATVLLRLRAEYGGETVLDMEVRTARANLMVSGDTKRPDGASFSWRLQCGVEIMSNQDRIRFSLDQAILQRQTEGSRLNLNLQASAILVSGEEKVLFKNDEVTLHVTAVLEPQGS